MLKMAYDSEELLQDLSTYLKYKALSNSERKSLETKLLDLKRHMLMKNGEIVSSEEGLVCETHKTPLKHYGCIPLSDNKAYRCESCDNHAYSCPECGIIRGNCDTRTLTVSPPTVSMRTFRCKVCDGWLGTCYLDEML